MGAEVTTGKDEDPKSPLIQPSIGKYEPPKKVFYWQALFTAASAGTSNFVNGFLDHQDFDVACLNFTGFLLLALIYKGYAYHS